MNFLFFTEKFQQSFILVAITYHSFGQTKDVSFILIMKLHNNEVIII